MFKSKKTKEQLIVEYLEKTYKNRSPLLLFVKRDYFVFQMYVESVEVIFKQLHYWDGDDSLIVSGQLVEIMFVDVPPGNRVAPKDVELAIPEDKIREFYYYYDQERDDSTMTASYLLHKFCVELFPEITGKDYSFSICKVLKPTIVYNIGK